MQRFGDSDFWYITKHFPINSRFDYKNILDGNWITDPLNENVTPSGTDTNNSTPKYQSDYFDIINKSVPRGSLIKDLRFNSSNLKKKMKYHVYLPHDYEKSTVNHILYALEGSDYLNYANINLFLDFMP